MSKEKILLINDVTGYGRVSCFAMLPILSSYGFHPYILPTALVSNTMDYGSSEILDTSDFMKNTIKKWSEFNFSFNTIATGFINSKEQADIIISLIKKQDDPFVMVDPIMAESGELYPGMYKGAIDENRKLIALSDICLPNLTEAEMLTNLYVGKESISDKESSEIINNLKNIGAKNIVITSCKDKDNQYFNLVYDSKTKKTEKVFFKKIEGTFIGTGDVFSATLLSRILSSDSLISAVEHTTKFLNEIVVANKNNPDKFDLQIEDVINKYKNCH